MKASGGYDVGVDSGSWSVGPVFHAGGTMPIADVEVYGSTFNLAFGSDTTSFSA